MSVSGDGNARVALVTGASRGIGRAIARRLAADGWGVALAAQTARPHRKLPGTIHSVAAEIERDGGRALPVRTDVRDPRAVARAVAATVEAFGRLDALVHNAGALALAPTAGTPWRRVERVLDVNLRGAFACVTAALPHLERAPRGHALLLCPPLPRDLAGWRRWLAPHPAYSVSKYAVSLAAIGWAEELRPRGVRVNGLWPRTVIDTAALDALPEPIPPERRRAPSIVADAAAVVLAGDGTGRLWLDEEALRDAGAFDPARYAVGDAAGLSPAPDLFVDEDQSSSS